MSGRFDIFTAVTYRINCILDLNQLKAMFFAYKGLNFITKPWWICPHIIQFHAV